MTTRARATKSQTAKATKAAATKAAATKAKATKEPTNKAPATRKSKKGKAAEQDPDAEGASEDHSATESPVNAQPAANSLASVNTAARGNPTTPPIPSPGPPQVPPRPAQSSQARPAPQPATHIETGAPFNSTMRAVYEFTPVIDAAQARNRRLELLTAPSSRGTPSPSTSSLNSNAGSPMLDPGPLPEFTLMPGDSTPSTPSSLGNYSQLTPSPHQPPDALPTIKRKSDVTLDAREKKKARNAQRPKIADVTNENIRKVLKLAIPTYRVLVSTEFGTFLDSGDERSQLVARAWALSLQDCKLTINDAPLTDSSRTIITNQASKERSAAKAAAEKAVMGYGFIDISKVDADKVEACKQANKELVQKLKLNNAFLFRTLGRDGMFEHPVIFNALVECWFAKKQKKIGLGLLFPQHFSPFPPNAIALVLAALWHCISEWSEGECKLEPFDGGKENQAVYETMLKWIHDLTNYDEHTQVYVPNLFQSYFNRCLHHAHKPVASANLPMAISRDLFASAAASCLS